MTYDRSKYILTTYQEITLKFYFGRNSSNYSDCLNVTWDLSFSANCQVLLESLFSNYGS